MYEQRGTTTGAGDCDQGDAETESPASFSRRNALLVVAGSAFVKSCSSGEPQSLVADTQQQLPQRTARLLAGTEGTLTSSISSVPAERAVMPVELNAEMMAANEVLASVELDAADVVDVSNDPVGSATWPQYAAADRGPGASGVRLIDPAEPEQTVEPVAPIALFRSTSSGLTAALVVNKLTFGPAPGLIARVEASGPYAFIKDQLGRTGPDPEVERRVADIAPIGWTPRESKENGVRSWWTPQYVTHAASCRAVHSQSQLYEMMCHLWMDHFCVFLVDEWARAIPRYQEKTIRPHAMGKFKDMLKATAHDVAMLAYLDNITNDASTPSGINENYGRELLELHTLGADRDGRQVYNEQDVRNAAAVMGGWGTGEHWSDFAFNPAAAYRGPDLSILGGAWSTAGTSGKAQGDSLLEFLATHPSTALNVALRICKRFVSDRPSQSLLDSTARVFLENDTAIVPTLQHVFGSEEFANSGGLKFRRPLEFHVALWRALGVNIPTEDYEGNDVRALTWYQHSINAQRPWNWQQPNGYPDDAGHWVTADLFATRWRDAFGMAGHGSRRWGGSPEYVYEAAKNSVGAGNPTAQDLVQAMATELGIGPLTPEDVATIVAEPKYENQVPLLLCHPQFQNR